MIITDKNAILGFLRGTHGDHLGRTLKDHIGINDYDMEKCHDRVQWMFMLHEDSKHANSYPLLTPEIVEEAKKDVTIIKNILVAVYRFEIFLGIGTANDVDKQRKWMTNRNHNLLRITRVIRSLRLFGLDSEAEQFYNNVMDAMEARGWSNAVAISYWDKALNDDIWETLQD